MRACLMTLQVRLELPDAAEREVTVPAAHRWRGKVRPAADVIRDARRPEWLRVRSRWDLRIYPMIISNVYYLGDYRTRSTDIPSISARAWILGARVGETVMAAPYRMPITASNSSPPTSGRTMVY